MRPLVGGVVLGSWALLNVAVIALVLGVQFILDRMFG